MIPKPTIRTTERSPPTVGDVDRGVCRFCDRLLPVELDEWDWLVMSPHRRGLWSCAGANEPPLWLRADVAHNYPNRLSIRTSLYAEEWGDLFPTRRADLERRLRGS